LSPVAPLRGSLVHSQKAARGRGGVDDELLRACIGVSRCTRAARRAVGMLLLRPHDCCSPEAGDCVLGAPGSERALWGSDSAIVAAMRTRSPLLAIALGLGLPAAGCGSSSPGDPDGGTPGSADDFPARYATAWCAMSKRCCEGA